ncbi:MAG: CBM96 family carbohydrate-binding protein [Promethearchaeota archaeon]
MFNIKRYGLALIIFIIFFLNVLSMISIVQCATIEKTKRIYTDRDSYIDGLNPDSNYGGQDLLEIGTSGPKYAYIHFDLSNRPENITKAEIVLDFFYVSETSLISIYIADSNNWGELTINWNNAPSKGALITSGYISNDGRYKFSLPKSAYDTAQITFIIETDEDWMTITSKDYQYLIYEEDVPNILYTYTIEAPSIMSIPGYNMVIFSIEIMSIVGVLIFYYKKRK